MKKQILLSLVILLISSIAFGQEVVNLGERNGVKVSYQLMLKDKGKKKDKYLMIIKLENTSSNDYYNGIPLTIEEDGTASLPLILDDYAFALIKVRNGAGMFGNSIGILGDYTQFVTEDNKQLIVIKAGSVYNGEVTFKVKTGETPMITNTFGNMRKIGDFKIKMFSSLLNGDYTSDCGNFVLNLSAESSPEKGDYLIQTVNGNQFIWLRKSETTFVREMGEGYSLTYNKHDKTFTYSTTDGLTCVWKKR